MTKYLIGVAIVIAGAAAVYFALRRPVPERKLLKAVSYVCEGGKTIDAAYYSDSVEIRLSDGRQFTLPQAISGSGARYANADESIVFLNKGRTAFLTEGSPDNKTYANCGEGAVAASGVHTYAASTFSVSYPDGFRSRGLPNRLLLTPSSSAPWLCIR